MVQKIDPGRTQGPLSLSQINCAIAFASFFGPLFNLILRAIELKREGLARVIAIVEDEIWFQGAGKGE